MQSDQEQPKRYATPEEALRSAQASFLSALQYNKELNLGVDSAAVARSTPGPPVRRVELDFEKLVVANPTTGFESLIKGNTSTVFPLRDGDSVVTIVELNRDERGWKVIGLAGKDIADDLSAVLKTVGNQPQQQITLYDVPNLQTKVYGVRSGNNAETFFTSYGGKFDIRRGVTGAALIPVLKADAAAFQQKYGEALKNQRLVR